MDETAPDFERGISAIIQSKMAYLGLRAAQSEGDEARIQRAEDELKASRLPLLDIQGSVSLSEYDIMEAVAQRRLDELFDSLHGNQGDQ